MAKAKVTQVSVQGLATNPNPNALPAGSCSSANNVLMRRPGLITPMFDDREVFTTSLGSYRPGKFLFDGETEFYHILTTYGEPVVWEQDPLDETMTGALQPYTINQTSSSTGTLLEQLQVKLSGNVKRDIGFIPGLTQSAFSHFRTLVTEKWGVIVNKERWAGLAPPTVGRAFSTTTGIALTSWLQPDNSVAYRANITLESTDDAKPYIVNGPVSSIVACKNVGGADSNTQTTWYVPAFEPQPSLLPDVVMYLNIYRNVQASVDTPLDLGDDFRLVKKVLVQEATVFGGFTFLDSVSDDVRNAGQALYTNASIEGPEASSFAPPVSRDVCIFKDTAFFANRASHPVISLQARGDVGNLISDNQRTNGIGYRVIASGATTSGNPTITGVSASDMLGIHAGQVFHGASPFPYGSTVISAGVSSITMSVNATATGSFGGRFDDAIKIVATYADGTTETSAYSLINFDTDQAEDPVSPKLAGFRILHAALDFDRVSPGLTFSVVHVVPAIKRVVNFTVAVTNGDNFSPAYTGNYVTNTDPLKSLCDTRPNRIWFAKTGEPEAVPLGNYLDVGAGTILKSFSNQSALFVLCTDGLFRITGDGTNWAVNQIDPTVFLLHPDCVTSVNNQIYAWVSDGIARITEDGATTISTDAIAPVLRDNATTVRILGAPYVWGPVMCGDSFVNEVWLNIVRAPFEGGEDWVFVNSFLYNDDSKNFMTQSYVYTAALYYPYASRMVFGKQPSSPESPFHVVVQKDFYQDFWSWRSAEVWFNPLQTDDKGNLKQWIDTNFFTANFVTSGGSDADTNDNLKALFDARGEMNDPTAEDVNVQNLLTLSRDVHYWAPRRVCLSDQLQIGFRSGGTLAGPYFEFQGFTLRYRVASDTLKR